MSDIIEITPYRNELYQHKFYVHSAYYKHIIGTGGTIIKQLSKGNNVCIRILKDESNIRKCKIINVDKHGWLNDQTKAAYSLVIQGNDKNNIACARQQIDQVISNSQNKLEFTHFISIPTNTDEIKMNFENFKENVLRENNSPGLKEGMFAEKDTLHLTVTMLLLLEKEDLEQATKALHECKRDVISSILGSREPLIITLKGIHCMESNPEKAKVLYTQVYEETGILQEICDKIFEYFLKQGLTRIEKNRKSIKLYVTTVKNSNLLNEQGRKTYTKFDENNILHTHKDTYFGKMTLTALHLSKKGTRDEAGYFETEATADLTNF